MYKKNIFNINYNLLKEKGIKVLLFDFDNTLIKKGQKIIDNKTKELINFLSKDFKIIIVSNSINSKKVKTFATTCNIDYKIFALKPLTFKIKKAIKDHRINEICFIGDQFLTDIWGANKMGIFSILVDKIDNDELSITKINRLIEKKIIKDLNKKHSFTRGEYYE